LIEVPGKILSYLTEKGTDIADHNCGSQNPAFNQRIKKEISTC